MNLDIVPIPEKKYQFELLSGGSDGSCYVHDVKLKIISEVSGSKTDEQTPNDSNLRRRHFSFSTQQSREEDVEENLGGDESSKRVPNGTATQKSQTANSAQSVRRDSKGRASPIRKPNSPTLNLNIPEYTYEFTPKLSFQTDFHRKDPYQKVIKYSPSAKLIFSAGSEGVIRFWSFPDYREVLKFNAHETEVNDMDVHPAGTHLISISRDGRNFIWNTFNGNLITTLVHDQVIPAHSELKNGIMQNAKYVAKKCRYGTVEGNFYQEVMFFLIVILLHFLQEIKRMFVCF